MRRRELLQGIGAAIAANCVVSTAQSQDPLGPFALPSTRFSANRATQLPRDAFKRKLPIPLAARPTAIGTFEELQDKPRVFGPADATPIGQCFHGVAQEWGETPEHWRAYCCEPSLPTAAERWNDKKKNFGTVTHYLGEKQIENWSGFPIKCFKIPIVEAMHGFQSEEKRARVYAYAGMVPGPSLKMRLGQPAMVRFENHLEAEMSIHLHGGHSPSHSDGFPSFYVLQGKARDYFYPNMLPLLCKDGRYVPDVGESQSTMWYHDHAMDATAYNVSKGVAGLAPCFGEEELKLIHDRVLPGLGPHSCLDPEQYQLARDSNGNLDLSFESPENPGFYKHELGKEPYFNPYDIPLVLQDKVFDDSTGQIAYDNTGHNGYLGDTMLVNGISYPQLEVRNRKYRFRILDGSNARVFSLRILSSEDFWRLQKNGVDEAAADDATLPTLNARHQKYESISKPYLRIGKDTWLWSNAVRKKRIVLTMANRADIVVDFNELTQSLHNPDASLKPGETREFFLVNTMPQQDGRGPKVKLDDGGDPRVLPLPFDTADRPVAELRVPMALMKFVVTYNPPGNDPGDPVGDAEASIADGTSLIKSHIPITDDEVKVVREFIFERGKGAWQVNSRFYDPNISNACPSLDGAEEWVFKNEGGGWWHPIHIHLESHQIVRYEKDGRADEVVDRADPPTPNRLVNLKDVTHEIGKTEVKGLHDTQVLGPNTVVRIRMRHRTWRGPFVFHCHNLEHEDMRMMFNFEPVPGKDHDPNIAPAARTHGNDVTLGNRVGELPWEYPPVPASPVEDSGVNVIPPRPAPKKATAPTFISGGSK